MNNLVYLCGPIHNKSYEQASNWRDYAYERFQKEGVGCLDPMRSKRYLLGVQKIDHSYENNPLATKKAITVRDRFDCMRADVVLANLSYEEGDLISIGSAMEIAWADSVRNPIIAILSEDSPYSNHPMVTECVGIVAKTLDEAIDLTIAVLK